MFDFKKTLLRAEFLKCYATLFLEQHKDMYPFQVGGLESGSIPLIAAIVMKAAESGMPVNGFLVRKSRKKSGTMSLIEGSVSNLPIVLVDDLMNLGISFTQQIEALEKYCAENKIHTRVHRSLAFFAIKQRSVYLFFREGTYALRLSLSSMNSRHHSGYRIFLDEVQNLTVNPYTYTCIWHWKGAIHQSLLLWYRNQNYLFMERSLYFGADNGHFMCLDTMTGKEQWSYHIAYGRQRT